MAVAGILTYVKKVYQYAAETTAESCLLLILPSLKIIASNMPCTLGRVDLQAFLDFHITTCCGGLLGVLQSKNNGRRAGV